MVALLLPDSLPYRALADSSGAFQPRPASRGRLRRLAACWTRTGTGVADRREAFDSVRAGPPRGAPAAAGELWAFVHDTTPPRISGVTVGDSVSATSS